jgi:hypothetical protein
MCKQEEYPSQPPFAGIEELINQILFVPNVPRQQISDKQIENVCSRWSASIIAFRSICRISQSVIAVADPMRNGCPARAFSPVQYTQGCFLAIFGYNRESDLAFLDIEDCVSRISLREDCLLLGIGGDFATFADGGEEVYVGDRRSLIFCDPHAVAMRTGARVTSA